MVDDKEYKTQNVNNVHNSAKNENAFNLKKYKEKLQENINTDIYEKEKEPNHPEVILFFSFDIANSSLYKNINYSGWAKVLSHIIRKLQYRVYENLKAQLWRVLGDEVIFIIVLKNYDEIYKYIDIIFDILTSTAKDIKSGNIFSTLEGFSESEKYLMKLQNIISLKGAAWIAIVSRNPNFNALENNEQYENISAMYDLSNNYKIFEFLGNDIDAGFRISKQTCPERLVLSFELAYILSRKTDILSKLHIITYKKLKGIWKDKLYPIIWYHNKGKNNDIEFDDSFSFDEIEENELVREYFFNKKGESKLLIDSFMFNSVDKALDKILIDRNLSDKIEKIGDVISKTNPSYDKNTIDKDYIKVDLMELHCVAVCYNKSTSKILIAKRSDNRNNNASKWEFGCAKASLETSIINTIKDEYEKDFNINIEPITDCTRKDDCQPIPLAIYQVKKSDGLHKGIITLAEIINDYDISKFEPTSKHNELAWIGEDELEDFNENTVPDFKETLKLAFKNLNENQLQESTNM